MSFQYLLVANNCYYNQLLIISISYRFASSVVISLASGTAIRKDTRCKFSARQRQRSSAKTTTSRARRAQRIRQGDRALLTLARASIRLAKHHGSAAIELPMVNNEAWRCGLPGCQHNGQGYYNFAGNAKCHKCGNGAPTSDFAKFTDDH